MSKGTEIWWFWYEYKLLAGMYHVHNCPLEVGLGGQNLTVLFKLNEVI